MNLSDILQEFTYPARNLTVMLSALFIFLLLEFFQFLPGDGDIGRHFDPGDCPLQHPGLLQRRFGLVDFILQPV